MASFLGSLFWNPGHIVPAQRLHGENESRPEWLLIAPTWAICLREPTSAAKDRLAGQSGFLTSPRLRVGRETPKGNQNTLTRKEPRAVESYAGKRELSPSQSYLEIKTGLDGLLLKEFLLLPNDLKHLLCAFLFHEKKNCIRFCNPVPQSIMYFKTQSTCPSGTSRRGF